jgi:hypothetical protein
LRAPKRGNGRRRLVAEGFAPRDVKLYTGKQILDNHEEYMGRRGVTSKVVGSVADDLEGREHYLGYAREDRCAPWARLPREAGDLEVKRLKVEDLRRALGIGDSRLLVKGKSKRLFLTRQRSAPAKGRLPSGTDP